MTERIKNYCFGCNVRQLPPENVGVELEARRASLDIDVRRIWRHTLIYHTVTLGLDHESTRHTSAAAMRVRGLRSNRAARRAADDPDLKNRITIKKAQIAYTLLLG